MFTCKQLSAGRAAHDIYHHGSFNTGNHARRGSVYKQFRQYIRGKLLR